MPTDGQIQWLVAPLSGHITAQKTEMKAVILNVH